MGASNLHQNKDPTLSWEQRQSIIVYCDVETRKSPKSARTTPSPEWLKKWVWTKCTEKQLSSPSTGEHPSRLGLVYGMKYIIGNTKDISRGLAKGMWVELRQVYIINNDEVKWNPDIGMHTTCASNVKGVRVKVLLGDSLKTKELMENLPVGELVLTTDKFQCKIDFVSGNKSEPQRLYLTVTQLPLIYGKCITGHKSQGLTLGSILVAEINPTPTWMYVVFSRTTTFSGFFLRYPLSRKCSFVGPNLSRLYFSTRMQVLHHKTRLRLSASEILPTSYFPKDDESLLEKSKIESNELREQLQHKSDIHTKSRRTRY